MLKIGNLKPAPGSTHRKKRVGRGESTGQGGTAGKGHKGALARSGTTRKLSYEGGQMPFARRIPKHGFTNISRKRYAVVNTCDLNRIESGTEVTPDLLIEMGFIKKNLPIKILGYGELRVALTIKVDAISAGARRKIEEAGGKVEVPVS